MLRKIKQLFSSSHSSQIKKEISKPDNLPQATQEDLARSADSVKKIGDEYFKSREWVQAEHYFKQALALDATQFEVYKNLGVVYYYQRKFEEAITCYDQAIKLKPDYAEAYSNRGLVLNDLNRFEEALENLNKAITLKPDLAFAHNNHGIALKNLDKPEEALESYNRAIVLKPDFAQAYNNLGNALNTLDRNKEALVSFNKAIKLNPDYTDAYFNRAEVQYSLKRFNNALKSYDRAIKLNPQHAEAHSNRALALKDLLKYDEAHASIDIAIKLKPDSAIAYNNRGLVLDAQNKPNEAISNYYHAIALKPECHEAHLNLGETLNHLKRHEEALVCYDNLIALKPDYAEAHAYRGSALKELKRLDEALNSYATAIKIKPELELIYGLWFETKVMLCDWSDYNQNLAYLESQIKQGKNVTAVLMVMWLYGAPEIQMKATKTIVNTQAPKNNPIGPLTKHPKHSKIRIAYFSADFSDHPVATLTAGLFEKHDKSKFELIAFSLIEHKNSYMQQRIKSAFDRFIDVSKLAAKEIALMARSLEIDIAIDLGGYTTNAQPVIFALRAAPIQVSYIGYPGTMGADFIDYIIADKTTIPESYQQYYSEKIAYLPSFQANDTKRTISDRKFSREELGLPPVGFVFCCFNNITKLTPSTFDSWMRILKQTHGSVLWLLDDNLTAVNNLKKEAKLRGVDGKRLIFAKRVPAEDYLARYRMGDLFLDTLPFNAGTTASDALWAGLPVLTLIGEAFASRMAASLLNAINLPELITTTQESYEALAIALATEPNKLELIKQKLDKNRLSTPLFNIQTFTQNLESVYIQMYKRYRDGLKPDNIESTM